MIDYFGFCKNCKKEQVGHDVHGLRTTDSAHQYGLREIDKQGKFTSNYLYLYRCRECKYNSIRVETENPEQIYPIIPDDKPLRDGVPEDIKKDFDEARLIVNYSVRSAITLLRICVERILIYITEEFCDEETKIEVKKAGSVGKKREIIAKSGINGLNTKIFDMIKIIAHYGDDNAHPVQYLDDSGDKETFDDLSTFIHMITEDVLRKKEADEKINNMKSKTDAAQAAKKAENKN